MKKLILLAILAMAGCSEIQTETPEIEKPTIEMPKAKHNRRKPYRKHSIMRLANICYDGHIRSYY